MVYLFRFTRMATIKYYENARANTHHGANAKPDKRFENSVIIIEEKKKNGVITVKRRQRRV